MFKKYPRLIKFIVPCRIKGKEDRHFMYSRDIVNNSPLYGLDIKTEFGGLSFIWEEIFDYLWT